MDKLSPAPIRWSDRLRRTQWEASTWSKILTTVMVFTSLAFLPSHTSADPGLSLMPEGTTFSQMDLLDEMVPIDNSPKMEELRAYVTTLDRLNSFVHPELTDGD